MGLFICLLPFHTKTSEGILMKLYSNMAETKFVDQLNVVITNFDCKFIFSGKIRLKAEHRNTFKKNNVIVCRVFMPCNNMTCVSGYYY